jgi:hypothetical protein
VSKVILELGEYSETENMRNITETKHAIKVGEEETGKLNTKVRKLSKKLLLIQATEAYDEKVGEPEEVSKELSKKVKKITNTKSKPKALIIESDDED